MKDPVAKPASTTPIPIGICGTVSAACATRCVPVPMITGLATLRPFSPYASVLSATYARLAFASNRHGMAPRAIAMFEGRDIARPVRLGSLLETIELS